MSEALPLMAATEGWWKCLFLSKLFFVQVVCNCHGCDHARLVHFFLGVCGCGFVFGRIHQQNSIFSIIFFLPALREFPCCSALRGARWVVCRYQYKPYLPSVCRFRCNDWKNVKYDVEIQAFIQSYLFLAFILITWSPVKFTRLAVGFAVL